MEIAERRSEIIRLLCRRKHETIKNLASEFCVSEKTIRRDVEALSLSEPIYTQTGRYGGGVYLVEGYSIDRMYMGKEELKVLEKLSVTAKENISLLSPDEKKILDAIILDYTKPKSA